MTAERPYHPRRHRPTYVLFLPGVPAIATCDCHLGRPVRYDRPLPLPVPTEGRRVA